MSEGTEAGESSLRNDEGPMHEERRCCEEAQPDPSKEPPVRNGNASSSTIMNPESGGESLTNAEKETGDDRIPDNANKIEANKVQEEETGDEIDPDNAQR